MNIGKSLTDSSTSESEDEGKMRKKMQKNAFPKPFFGGNMQKSHSSASETDEELNRKIQPVKVCPYPNILSLKRNFSDDAEDENVGSTPHYSDDDFKAPKRYREIDFSGSESDDRSSVERSVPTTKMKPPANNAADQPLYNNIGQKMMAKMGYVKGKGLGKHSQGRTEIVEASKQRGRRGLGLHIQGLEPDDNAEWDFSREQESVSEKISWLPEGPSKILNISELRTWIHIGKKKETIDDETEFVDPDILLTVLKFKSVFDKLEGEEMRKARTRSNPFETIRGVFFLNRAAMKMANMDACFDFMFTNPKDKSGAPVIGPDDLLYFADICAGPGGFSEYILWRKKWECKGFGFTLKGANDFKLEEFFSGSPETFEPFYGVNGTEGDGDIYNPENLREFRRFVLENTDGKGVHFVMADGGFSVDGKENLQEILSKRLYLCQFLCSLMILRTGGHFVCKLFDLFTPFSVGLVYLMYYAFDRISIFKPNTSRPANSERYIICKWKRENTKDICDYLFEVNCQMEKFHSLVSEEDIMEIVPLHILKNDKEFCDYITESNNVIGDRQILHLEKIRIFAANTNLHDTRQSDFRKQCLEAWKIPDAARSAPKRPDAGVRIKELLQGENLSYLNTPAEVLNMKTLPKLTNIYDFKCVVCGEVKNEHPRTFYLSLGRSNIYYLDFKTSKWQKLGAALELPENTLFYGEMIHELKGEGKAQKKIMCLHIIDALFLGGKDIRRHAYEHRIHIARKLVKAVSKPSRLDFTPLRVKKVWSLADIKGILDRLVLKVVKGNANFPRLCFDLEDERHFLPFCLLVFRTISDPWVSAYSKTYNQIYFFDTKKQMSIFERNKENVADFKTTFTKRAIWHWDKDTQLVPSAKSIENNCLIHSNNIISFVRDHIHRLTGRPPDF